jgi:hypothetical protein
LDRKWLSSAISFHLRRKAAVLTDLSACSSDDACPWMAMACRCLPRG